MLSTAVGTSRNVARRMLASCLAVVAVVAPSATLVGGTSFAATGANVVVTQSVSPTSLTPGSTVTYTINYSCASSVAGTGCDGAILRAPMPSFVDAAGAPLPLQYSTSVGTADFTANGFASGEVTFIGTPAAIAGDSGLLSISYKVPDYGWLAGTTTSPPTIVTVTPSAGGTGTPSGPVTVQVVAAPPTAAGMNIRKVEQSSQATTFTRYLSMTAAANPITYDLWFEIPQGAGQFATYTLSDALPVGATFMSATDGGTLSAGTVTWNLTPASLSTPSSGPIKKKVSVTVYYLAASAGGHASNTPGAAKTNSFNLSASAPTGTVAGTSNNQIINLAAPTTDVFLVKDHLPAGQTDFPRGGNITWTIIFGSHSAASEGGALPMIVTDPIPANTTVTQIAAGQFMPTSNPDGVLGNADDVYPRFDIQISPDGATWTTVIHNPAGEGLNPPPTVTAGLAGARFVRWVFTDPMPSEFVAGNSSGWAPTIVTKIDAAYPGATLQNCTTLAATYASGTTNLSSCNTVNVGNSTDGIWVSKKSRHWDGSAGDHYAPGDKITFEMAAFPPATSTTPVDGFRVDDCLATGVQVLDGNNDGLPDYFDGNGALITDNDPNPATPNWILVSFGVADPVRPCTHTVLEWQAGPYPAASAGGTIGADYLQNGDSTFKITYDAQIGPMAAGPKTNTLTPQHLDGSPFTTCKGAFDELYGYSFHLVASFADFGCTTFSTFVVDASTTLESYKMVNGTILPPTTFDPSSPGDQGAMIPASNVDDWTNSAVTTPGGSMNWGVVLANNGATSVVNPVFVDVLPHVGDTGVLDAVSRGTQWPPYLSSQVDAPAGWTVEYSTAINPCRPELGYTAPGCTAPGWTATPSTAIASYHSLRLTYTGVVAPGESYQFTWSMRAPLVDASYTNVNACTVGISGSCPKAVNSFGYTTLKAPGATVNGNAFRNTDNSVLANYRILLFADADGDGALTAGELTPIGQTTSDAVGNFTFADLDPTVKYLARPDIWSDEKLMLPDNSPAALPTYVTTVGTLTAPTVASANPATDTLISEPPRVEIRVQGQPTPVSLGDLVWNDLDNDGQLDAGESGVAGVQVELVSSDGASIVYDLTGNPVVPAFTDVNGRYSFTNLAVGDYRVRFTLPAGYQWTAANVPADDGLDSDPTYTTTSDPTAITDVITLTDTPVADTDTNINHRPVTDPTIDAGIVATTVSVGDLVWIDSNRDGLFNISEAGVAGVTVELLTAAGNAATDSVGAPVAPVVTDAIGRYSFTNLAVGDYKVRFTLPGGYMWTGSNVAGSDSLDNDSLHVTPFDTTATTATFTLTASPVTDGDADSSHRPVTDPTIDAGVMFIPVSVGDYTWNDVNRDGQQDAGEPAIPAVTVTLYEADGATPAVDVYGNAVPATVTDAAGFYSFTDLIAGHQYVAQFSMPAAGAWVRTVAATGATSSDSNANTSTGFTTVFTTPTSGANSAVTPDDPTIDAGYYQQVSIGDYTWIDVNRDGQQTIGEPALANVTVSLVESGTTIATTVTDAAGFYIFTGLTPGGAYTVTFTAPAGYSLTAQNSGADTTDSDPNSTGAVAVTAPASGANSSTVADDPTIDAGFVSLDLTISKTLTSAPQAFPGDTVTFTIQPHNNGPVDALAGWTVTENLPSGLTFVSITGSGYTCAGNVCTATAGLPAGSDGPALTVTATLNAGVTTVQRNITYITPAAGETAETNALVIPAAGADTTLTATNNDAHADVNPAPLLSVGDLVWSDLNQNGLYDNGEPGIPGVTVQLLDAAGTPAVDASDNPVPVTGTDSNGRYQFSGLNPGDYEVQFSLPAGYFWTVSDAAGSDSLDNDAAHSTINDPTATTATFTLTSTAVVDGDTDTNHRAVTNPTIDAGVVPYVSIGDYVWLDVNRDGQQNAGEPAVPWVTVTLTGPTGTTTTTDASGFYSFTDLTPSAGYTVTFTPPAGYAFTGQNVGAAASDSNADIGTGAAAVTTPATGSNSAATPDDPTIDAGLVAVDLTVSKTLATAGAVYPDGTVTFVIVPHNNGPVDALAGWSVTDILPLGLTATSITGPGYTCDMATLTCADTTGVNLSAGTDGGPITVTATVDPTVASDGQPATLHNVTYVTPASGEIVETNPLTVPGTADDTDTSGTNNDAQADVTVSPLASIGDYVWHDVNADGTQDAGEPGVANVSVHLYDATGVEVATAVTDTNGLYSFTGLIPGDYHISVDVPAGYQVTLHDQGIDDTDSDIDAAGVMGATTLVAGENDLTWDAGLVQRASLGDFVWYDANRDGIQDAGETPVPAVPVHLSGVDMFGNAVGADTVTGTNGFYLFGNLTPGSYQVTFAAPSGWYITTANQGADLAVDSDANPATGITPTVVLGSGENDMTWDAGVYQRVSIGDHTWIDVNRNGTRDAGEPALPGVTVTLANAAGVVVDTQTTDSNGFYSFADLVPGVVYTVTFTAGGYTFTSQHAAGAAVDSDADQTTGQVTVTAPTSGVNSAATPDDPTIDAGFVAVDLTITKSLTGSNSAIAGATVTYSLVPHNSGPADALTGWKVKETPPVGLTITGLAGSGYLCDLATLTCVDNSGVSLAAGVDGATITVTATVGANVAEHTVLHNVVYITPAPGELVETNQLIVPTTGTDTAISSTNNDADADLNIIKAPVTGADTFRLAALATAFAALGAALVLLGGRRMRKVRRYQPVPET